MPEGDTIYRTAAKLRAGIAGRDIRAAQVRALGFQADSIIGQTLTDIEARGKHLLMHLSDDRVIHSHMGMTGAWHVYRHDQKWRKPQRQAELILRFEPSVAVCFSPKVLELLSYGELKHHRWLVRLGPDLLAGEIDVEEIIQCFRRRDELPIGEAVMNQAIVSGIGNVYKSELLFLAGIHPLTRVADLSSEALGSIVTQARKLLKRNVLDGPRRTRFCGDGIHKWVYGRAGQACLKCGETIRLTRQGDLGRTTYFCPPLPNGIAWQRQRIGNFAPRNCPFFPAFSSFLAISPATVGQGMRFSISGQ